MDVVDLTCDADEARPKRGRRAPASPVAVEFVDLTGEDSPRAGARSRPARLPGGSGRAKAALTRRRRGHSGVKRVQKEYTALARACEAGEAPCSHLSLPDEGNVLKWAFRLHSFDDSLPGGAALNADLARLGRQCGQSWLACEAIFPPDYPSRPFLLRLVSPRCCWYTGHVTAGGSICIEALTQTGSPNSWRPDYCVCGLLPLVKQNLIDVEAVQVRTASGPGGLAGPLRLDFESRWGVPLMMPYSEAEALAAFRRTEEHHRSRGW